MVIVVVISPGYHKVQFVGCGNNVITGFMENKIIIFQKKYIRYVRIGRMDL